MSGEKREEKGRAVEKGEKSERGEICRKLTEWETEKVERRERNGEEREGRRK